MKYSVKRVITMCFAVVFCITIMTGCGANEQNESDSQQVKIVVAADDESTITYCDDYIRSTSGGLYVTNCSEYPISILLIRQDKGTNANEENEEISLSLNGKETKLIESCDKNVPYEIGCRTTASEGEEIKLTFKEYDE